MWKLPLAPALSPRGTRPSRRACARLPVGASPMRPGRACPGPDPGVRGSGQRIWADLPRRTTKPDSRTALAGIAEQAPFYIFTAFVFTSGTTVLHSSRDLLLTALLGFHLSSITAGGPAEPEDRRRALRRRGFGTIYRR